VPAGAITFLTPQAGLVALAVVLPLAALVLAEQRLAYARSLLRLPAPGEGSRWTAVAALAAVPILLGFAAAQPAVRTLHGARVRTDAETVFVLDTSRSMLASDGRGGPTRLARARNTAVRLRSELAAVPSGVATLTDRALPNLFPTGDAAAFGSTVESVQIERPPPQDISVTATTFGPVADVATKGYFTPSASRRLIVVLTDGESKPFSTSAVARALGAGPGASLLLVRVGGTGDRIYSKEGRVEAYRPNPDSGAVLAGLAAATHGEVFREDQLGAAGAAARAALGQGPTATRGREPRTTPLAPYVAAAAAIPLLLVLRRRNL
jgi:VWA domain-containing protein